MNETYLDKYGVFGYLNVQKATFAEVRLFALEQYGDHFWEDLEKTFKFLGFQVDTLDCRIATTFDSHKTFSIYLPVTYTELSISKNLEVVDKLKRSLEESFTYLNNYLINSKLEIMYTVLDGDSNPPKGIICGLTF